MKISQLLCIVIITFITLVHPSFAATNDDFSLTQAEQITFTKNTLNTEQGTDKRLSFFSFAQNFNLILRENNEIMTRFSSALKNIKLYEGEVEGSNNSWVRLNVIDGHYSGAIFDGKDLYIIDEGKNVVGALQNKSTNKSDMQSASTAIYKSSDLSSHMNCGNHDEHNGSFSYNNLIPQASLTSNLTSEESAGFEAAQVMALDQINLRIVADTQYVATSDTQGGIDEAAAAQAQVLSQMNVVDGIFSAQVGVQFGITDIEVLTDNGPLISNDASTLLNEFLIFTGQNNPGLSHLFTGRNIDGNTVGIAFLNALCRSSGVGLTQAGGRGMIGALTAAHEFGHNFGAPHDNEQGSICANEAGTFLMNPSINGSTEFSQCSLSQIAPAVASARSQCLVPVDTTPPEPAPSCELSIDFSTGLNEFEFIADPQTPLYSSRSFFQDTINTLIGGVDDNDIENIEGVWSRQCINDNASNFTFNINASLSQSSEYEANEFSQIAVRINGDTTLLDTLTGDGNGGISPSTGLQQYNVTGPLNAGVNTIELVCFNNLKTLTNETTQCQFSDFSSTETSEVAELCLPIQSKDSSFVIICL